MGCSRWAIAAGEVPESRLMFKITGGGGLVGSGGGWDPGPSSIYDTCLVVVGGGGTCLVVVGGGGTCLVVVGGGRNCLEVVGGVALALWWWVVVALALWWWVVVALALWWWVVVVVGCVFGLEKILWASGGGV